MPMMPVPWSHVSYWRCTGCGICCKKFDVVLKFDEWLRLVKTYGIGVTTAGLNKFYLNKRPDGSCVFLTQSGNISFCGLQNMKPLACKLWPFRILDKPKYGRPNEAAFNYNGRRLYVYIDPLCPEILWGKPTPKMVYKVIPEFIEIALGLREKQFYSTATPLYSLYPKTRRRYRII
ncbi:zinc/iron-chelating domain-containing protein [Candidatus Bathyarchaeota archaeon ex4484_231]|nr:MAG: zinc/iron-chelating domain-containing protein [Candidatus Bathyarchaeota archaeon ex4484_231]RJS75319.1 MAG: YkgJ family cysteine cluster protein [Candidatus Bathyarchaeota archaeon]